MNNTTRKRLPEEQKKNDNKIQKTSKLTHEEIHERVMIALNYPEIREMYEKQGLNAYDTLYKLKSKLSPCDISLEIVNGRRQYLVYDERGNKMDPEDEDVKNFIKTYQLDND